MKVERRTSRRGGANVIELRVPDGGRWLDVDPMRVWMDMRLSHEILISSLSCSLIPINSSLLSLPSLPSSLLSLPLLLFAPLLSLPLLHLSPLLASSPSPLLPLLRGVAPAVAAPASEFQSPLRVLIREGHASVRIPRGGAGARVAEDARERRGGRGRAQRRGRARCRLGAVCAGGVEVVGVLVVHLPWVSACGCVCVWVGGEGCGERNGLR